MVKLNINMRQNRFGEWALVQMRNHSLTPAAALLSDVIIKNVRKGSLQDDLKYGQPGNKAQFFVSTVGVLSPALITPCPLCLGI